jgi:hypothetical protein
MHVSIKGDLPGLKALIEMMNAANRHVLVGVPVGAMDDGRHARTEDAANKRKGRALKNAKKALKNGRGVSEKLAETLATGGAGEPIPLAMIAAVHEFGCPERNIPERSFLRAGIRRGTPKFNRLNVDSLRKVVRGEMTIATALDRLGVVAVGEVKREFVVGSFAPLKPETIKRKGSSRPLIDTGQLRQSITYIGSRDGSDGEENAPKARVIR